MIQCNGKNCFNLQSVFPQFLVQYVKYPKNSRILRYGNIIVELLYFRYYCHCARILTGMCETQFQNHLSSVLSEDAIIKHTVDHEFSSRLQPTIEEENLGSTDTVDVTDNVISISGIYLPKFSVTKSDSGKDLVLVQSTENNLRKIALGIAANKAICLQSPVGSGKTSLVEYLAAKTGRVLGDSFIKVQLGDQTDSKMLLGTYRCTDVPGEFVWQPGVLTQVRCWVYSPFGFKLKQK